MDNERVSNEELIERYAAALNALDTQLLDLLEEVAVENKLSENEALALAIIGLWSRAKDKAEGRVYISVPADSLRTYEEPLDVLLGEGADTYAEVIARLKGEVM